MPLELGSLIKAVDAFKRSVKIADELPSPSSPDLRDTIRAGVIQNFEVAYEQSWKFIQRWIRENRTPEDADHPRTRKELFRIAARSGLVSDPLPWFVFGDARNMTGHVYDAVQAAAVYAAARRFPTFAEELLNRLKAQND
jgi:nucleotidyltransferase substrate binding protein (TIGR01987 family)